VTTADGSGTTRLLDWTQRSLCDEPSWRAWSEPETPSPEPPLPATPRDGPRAPTLSTPQSVERAVTSRVAAPRMGGAAQLTLSFEHTSTASMDPVGPARPTTRGDCCQDVRPCPWVGCKHHLLVTEASGRLRLNLPSRKRRPTLGPHASDAEVELWIDDVVEALQRMPDTCSLDIADRYAARGVTLGKRKLARYLGMSPSGARKEINRAEQALRDAFEEQEP
jgi:hypothetical protein